MNDEENWNWMYFRPNIKEIVSQNKGKKRNIFTLFLRVYIKNYGFAQKICLNGIFTSKS